MSNQKSNNNSAQKTTKIPNPLEALKEVTQNTASEMKREAMNLPKNLLEELLGPQVSPFGGPSKNYSGELFPGEAVEMKEVLSGRHDELSKERAQISHERMLLEEERALVEKRSGELRMQINAIREELVLTASKTADLAEEIQIATMQAPINPGMYHLIFFEQLLEFIRSYRKKIETAAVWLHSANKRAGKKGGNWVQNYKAHGAKYLLSGEHYNQRSAG